MERRSRQGQMEVVMTAQLSPESLHNLRHNHLWSKVFYIAIVKNICVKYYFQIITAILSSRMDFTFKKCKKWQVQAPVAAGWAAAGWAVSVVRCDKATVTMSPLTKTCTRGGPCRSSLTPEPSEYIFCGIEALESVFINFSSLQFASIVRR